MKMNKIAFVVISALCVFTFFSCDLLTKPLLEQIGLGDVLQYAPDAESLGNADTTVLANAAGDISIAADPVASKAVLEALGTKDEDEILDLSDEQKDSILSLTTSAILPIDQIISVATNAMTQSQEGNGESGNGNGGNNTGNNEDGMQAIIKNMVEAIPFVDTQATEYIILDAVDNMPTLGENDPTPENVPNILLATISVAISACKSNGENTIDISTQAGQDAISNLLQNVFEDDSNNNNQTPSTPAEIAEDILTALSEDDSTNPAGVRALTNAITVFKTLANKNIQVSGESLMGMLAGGMMGN